MILPTIYSSYWRNNGASGLKKRKNPFFLLSGIVFIFFGCGYFDRSFSLDGRNIICFGNSITEGVGANAGEDYPSVLAEKLDYPVINAGHGGDTTRNALERLASDVLEKNPGLVIVEFGGNDFLQKIPRQETFSNLEEVVRRIQQAGAKVVLVSIRVGIFYDEYYKDFKNIAGKTKVTLIPDILKGIFDNPTLKSDGLHPNSKGYKIIAERVYPYVVPWVRKK